MGISLPSGLAAAVIGDPISHSLSPVLHSTWFESLGDHVTGEYGRLHIKADDLGDFISALKSSTLAGINVTVPHKEAVMPYLDTLAPSAREIGAVNTILNRDGQLIGYNTDGIGFLNHLKNTATGWRKDLPALVIGAGGAARAVLHALLSTEIPMVMITNRSGERAERLGAELGRGRAVSVPWQSRSEAVSGVGLIVNTTSLGMSGQPSLDLDLAKADSGTVVYDIVYSPLETKLLAEAKARQLPLVDGLGMLIHQGAAAFKLWFGEKPDTGPSARARVLAALHKG